MSVPRISSPEAINMADDGFWAPYLTPEALSVLGAPLVDEGDGVVGEGMWNTGVVGGMEKNCVVEESTGTGKKAAESMVGPAAGSSSQSPPFGFMDQGPASNEEYSRLMFHLLQTLSFAAGVSGSTVEVGNNGGYSGFASPALQSSVVGVEAPCGMLNLGKKRAGGSAPPGARASKKRRSRSGSIGTSGGSNDEAMGSEFSHEAAVVAAPGNGAEEEEYGAWWAKVSSPGYTDADFKRDFHMSRSTFDILCNMLDATVRKQDIASGATIPVPKRVAACVFHVATATPFRQLSKRFGIGVSTCHKIVRENVIPAINTVVQPGSVSALWPKGADDMEAAAEKFKALTGGIPGVIGVVYTTQIPMMAPKLDASKYYNRRLTERRGGKTTFSVTLHAAVDTEGSFTDLCVGNPGGMSDEKIFLSSMSEKRAAEMVAQGKRLVGGAGYPLTDCMLVPYTHDNLTLLQRKFNKKVALARGVALDASRRLKARWAILRERAAWKDLEDFSSVIAACCVLHNLCERNGDELGDELQGFELEDDEMVVDDPVRSDAAAQVRDEIAHN